MESSRSSNSRNGLQIAAAESSSQNEDDQHQTDNQPLTTGRKSNMSQKSTSSAAEDNNYDEEYEKLRESMSSGLTLLDELKTTLDSQLGSLNDKTLQEIVQHNNQLGVVRNDVVKVKKMLHATDKFLTNDLTTSVSSVRQTLAEYSSIIYNKLQQQQQQQQTDNTKKAEQLAADGTKNQVLLARITCQLKELELFAAQIEESANKLATNDVVAEADDADRLLNEYHNEQEESEENLEEKQLREEHEQERKQQEEQLAREAEEERLRQEEEARYRKEEEEARRLEEEEKLRKEDSRHWPSIVYPLEVDDEDPLGCSIACVIRANEESVTVRQEQIKCTFVSWQKNRYVMSENEEVVSAMINLKPADAVPLQFESAIWIAIPYSSGSRNRETIIRFQENTSRSAVAAMAAAEKEDGMEKTEDASEQTITESARMTKSPQPPSALPVLEPAEWKDVLTRDTTVEGQELVRFVETPIKELDCDGVNIIVLTRPKRDVDKWNNKGGRLVSSVDQRVSIAAPKNAFRLSTDVALQVVTIDSNSMTGLKERYDNCEQLLGSSPMLLINISNKPTKPLTINLTNPSGGGKKNKSETAGKSLPRTTNGKQSANGFGSLQDQDDVLSVLVKDASGKWRHRDAVQLEQQRDCVTFQLNEVPQRLLVLRTMPDVESVDLCRIVSNLEMSLQERAAQLVVRQSADDPTLVYIECCRRDAVEKLISGRLQSAKFTDGPEPSRVFVLHEGDLIEVSFRDNIHAIEDKESRRQFVFNSNLSSINLQLTVGEVNGFAQNALDIYRGFVRLSLVERPYQPPPKLVTAMSSAAVMTNTKKTAAIGSSTKATAPIGSQDKHLITEVILTLPKPPKEITEIKRTEVPITGPDPLSTEYFDQLAIDVGEDWMRLADKLKISRPAMQRISRQYAHVENNAICAQRSAREMFTQWYRSSTKCHNKVEELRQALVDAGRNDLAEELNNKYKEARHELEKKQEELRLQKSIKVFLETVTAVKAWKDVGKGLGLNLEELEEIGATDRSTTGSKKNSVDTKQAREFAQQMLNKWKETAGEKASADSLLSVVKKLKLNNVAASMSMVIN